MEGRDRFLAHYRELEHTVTTVTTNMKSSNCQTTQRGKSVSKIDILSSRQLIPRHLDDVNKISIA